MTSPNRVYALATKKRMAEANTITTMVVNGHHLIPPHALIGPQVEQQIEQGKKNDNIPNQSTEF
jgi:hypothetical protein